MRIRVLGAMAGVLAATLTVVPVPGGASAEAAEGAGTTVVRGTTFPEPLTAQLSFVGCADLPGLVPEVPRAQVGTGTVAPPAGARSLGFDLAGGNAVGALFMRPAMAATTTADLQVYAEVGARGVAYAAYQEPADAGTSRVWVGRADLVTRASGWQRVDATGMRYSWTKRDLGSGAVLGAGPATAVGVVAFAATHGGDGSGFYTLGFGCDGRPFSIDVLRVGTAGGIRTFDLEGLATTTTLTASREAVAPGEPVRLSGAVRDQSGARLAQATVALEQRTGSGPWKPVFRDADAATPSDPVVVDAGAVDPQVEVTPERTTSYRFRFADRPLAEGSTSAAVTVTVGAGSGPEATEGPSDDAGPTPAHPAGQQPPAQAPASQPSTAPAPGPDQGPASTGPGAGEPTREPTQDPRQDPTQDPAPATAQDPARQPDEQPDEQPGPGQQAAGEPSASASTKPEQPAADQPAAPGTSGP